MRILQLNNYHFTRGGSEVYYFALSRLLNEHGHAIAFFSVKDPQNYETEFAVYFAEEMTFDGSQTLTSKFKTALTMIYSFENNRKIDDLLHDYKIDIAHAHNIYHRVCPSVFNVLKKRDIPVIVTLHDYKLGCPIYTFYRDGKICTECLQMGKYRVVYNRCTKGSFLFSSFHYLEAVLHKSMGLYINNVDFFICPSRFSLKKHEEIGIPEKKLVYVPNFVFADFYEPNYENKGYLLFVGRLSREKGILTLLKAVQGMEIEVRIVGDGPMRWQYEDFIKENDIGNVKFEGYKSGDELRDAFRNAAFLVFPSEWYENAPMTILEAFAYGKPVIGSNIGGIPEMVIDGETGFLFTMGDHDELREKIQYLLSNPVKVQEMGRNARKRAEVEYSADIHYKRLMEVYQKALS